MSLAKGDHIVIKRNGLILTPDVGEAYHEFEVTDFPEYDSARAAKEWVEAGSDPNTPHHVYYNVKLRVVR